MLRVAIERPGLGAIPMSSLLWLPPVGPNNVLPGEGGVVPPALLLDCRLGPYPGHGKYDLAALHGEGGLNDRYAPWVPLTVTQNTFRPSFSNSPPNPP